MREFIISHIDSLISLVISLAILLIAILKKKVKISDVFEMVLTVLPGYISYAEKTYSDGRSKYGYVFNRCVDLLVMLTNDSNEEVIKKYAIKIDIAIENILSTPQKKGCDVNER